MGPDTIWVFIPITAIALGIGSGVVQSMLKTFERLQMARIQSSQTSTGLSDDLVVQLRQEIAVLRDTTTQHAISLQQSVERLEHRVEFMERKSIISEQAPAKTLPTETPVQQIAGRI